MLYLIAKAVHVIGFITWFAGLFYLVRLFVYHAEAIEGNNEELLKNQFDLMSQRLYQIITTPGMIITWIAGITMICIHPDLLQQNWLRMKLGCLVILTVYHLNCPTIMVKLRDGVLPMSSWRFRLWNEVPTLLMAIIVFLAVLRNGLNTLYSVIGFVVFAVVLFVAARMYKRHRLGRK